MKIFDFEIDDLCIKNNHIEFANTIRTLIFGEDESIFDLIDIEDDKAFLEPTLFFHFLAKDLQKSTATLMQCLWGYIPINKRPDTINVLSDANGMINLPNYGYFKSKPNQLLQLCWNRSDNQLSFYEEGRLAFVQFIPDIYIEKSKIRICQHEPELLTKVNELHFQESIETTLRNYQTVLNSSWSIMKEIVPEFCYYIELTTKEISIFHSINQESRASFSYNGTAFLNVQNQPRDEVFFIDDIAHQCGHVLFYTLSLPATTFLKPAPRTPLKTFTLVDWEPRDVYGCFHGLFTYSTVLYCLDACLDHNVFDGHKRHEIIARIAFYMNKFRKDIAHLNDARILTDKGFEYFDSFKKGYDSLYEKYKSILRKVDFSNQTYFFNYSLFNQINPQSSFA